MTIVKGLDIYIARGDADELVIDFEDDIPPDNTIAIITLKKYSTDDIALWVKQEVVTNGSIPLTLDSRDTNYEPGDYMYDIKLIYADDRPYTPMKPALFKIERTVGDLPNEDIST